MPSHPTESRGTNKWPECTPDTNRPLVLAIHNLLVCTIESTKREGTCETYNKKEEAAARKVARLLGFKGFDIAVGAQLILGGLGCGSQQDSSSED